MHLRVLPLVGSGVVVHAGCYWIDIPIGNAVPVRWPFAVIADYENGVHDNATAAATPEKNHVAPCKAVRTSEVKDPFFRALSAVAEKHLASDHERVSVPPRAFVGEPGRDDPCILGRFDPLSKDI